MLSLILFALWFQWIFYCASCFFIEVPRAVIVNIDNIHGRHALLVTGIELKCLEHNSRQIRKATIASLPAGETIYVVNFRCVQTYRQLVWLFNCQLMYFSYTGHYNFTLLSSKVSPTQVPDHRAVKFSDARKWKHRGWVNMTKEESYPCTVQNIHSCKVSEWKTSLAHVQKVRVRGIFRGIFVVLSLVEMCKWRV